MSPITLLQSWVHGARARSIAIPLPSINLLSNTHTNGYHEREIYRTCNYALYEKLMSILSILNSKRHFNNTRECLLPSLVFLATTSSILHLYLRAGYSLFIRLYLVIFIFNSPFIPFDVACERILSPQTQSRLRTVVQSRRYCLPDRLF